jgi:hypothetical protein
MNGIGLQHGIAPDITIQSMPKASLAVAVGRARCGPHRSPSISPGPE